MAYEGPINYLHIQRVPEWYMGVHLSDDSSFLQARVAKLSAVVRYRGKAENEWMAYDQKQQEIEHFWFDRSTPETPAELRCALLGRDAKKQRGTRKYYVLLLPAEDTVPLERLGIGRVHESVIDFGSLEFLKIA